MKSLPQLLGSQGGQMFGQVFGNRGASGMAGDLLGNAFTSGMRKTEPPPVPTGNQAVDDEAMEKWRAGNAQNQAAAGVASRAISHSVQPFIQPALGAASKIMDYGGPLGPLKALGDGAEAASKKVQQLAQNDFKGIIGGALDNIPIFGEYLKKMTFAVGDATEALVERGRQLKNLSAPLAEASAKADARKLMADFREGQRIGDSVSNLMDTKSQMEVKFQDALAPLKDSAARILDKMLTLADKLKILESIGVSAEIIATNVEAFDEILNGNFNKAGEIFLSLPQRIKDAFDKKDADVEGYFDQVWDNTNKLIEWGNQNTKPNLGKVGDGRMNMKIFDGL